MKKILLLSVVASTMIMANGNIAPVKPVVNSTLEGALVNGTLKGEIKSVFSASNFLGKASSTNVLAVGGSLNYVTGSFYGFKLGTTFQTSHVPSASHDTGALKSAGATDDQPLDIGGSRLSEAYLEYTLNSTTLKVGRQYIHTPLVSSANDGKGSEGLVKDSFSAGVITNTDLPNTTLVAAYITKWQQKTDGLGNIGNFKNLEDGAFTFYVKNNSIANLTLQAQYAELKGKMSTKDSNVIFAQGDYKLGTQTISAQYFRSDENGKTGNIWAVKATGPLGIGKLGYLAAYSSSSNDSSGAILTGYGAGAGDALFTSTPVEGKGVPLRPSTDTAVVALVIPTSFATFIPYGGEAFRSTGLGNVPVLGAMAIVPVGKHLMVSVKYEHSHLENLFGPFVNKNNNMTRVFASYKF